MGLPLYISPVESDIPGKPAPKSPAHARSSIRRLRRRHSEAARENRRRASAAAAAYLTTSDSWPPRSRSASNEPSAAPSTSNPGSNSATAGGSSRARESLRDIIGNRMGALDDRVVALFGDRWASLHARSNPSPPREDPDDVAPPPLLPLDDPTPERWDLDSNAFRRRAILQSDPEPSRRRMPPSPPPPPRRDFPWVVRRGFPMARRGSGRRPAYAHSLPRRTEVPVPYEPGQPQRSSALDGLGDRERSLSPEDDGVWDTLLSTLTPDPQPPSAGSSFASASASAVASQSAAAGSSSTSLTGPDTAEEDGFEHHCESGCENSDTEGDDDEEMEHNTLTRFPPSLRHSLSYAEIASRAVPPNSNSDEALELLGGIGGMQRIVRNLARREDIPDEWWAEAGLSRTLSREAST